MFDWFGVATIINISSRRSIISQHTLFFCYDFCTFQKNIIFLECPVFRSLGGLEDSSCNGTLEGVVKKPYKIFFHIIDQIGFLLLGSTIVAVFSQSRAGLCKDLEG
jgi:hypothetical protein